MSVIVYSMPNCPQCSATYKLLEREGISYETVDLTADKAAFEAVQQLGYLKAPVVKVESSFGEQAHWAGFRPDKIKALTAQLARELVAA